MALRGEDVRKDRESFDEMRDDDLEADFQQAVKWRHRIKTCKATLAESSPRVMWGHVDALIKVATAWRGGYLSILNEREKHEKGY